MGFRYVCEKAYDGVSSLAVGTGTLDERLANAIIYNLSSLDDEHDFGTVEAQELYGEIMDLPGEGALSERVAALEHVQQHELAEKIVSFYYAVEREAGRREGAGERLEG